MSKRLNEIFSVIPKCKSFTDVGCDHGYIAEMMLNNAKTEYVQITDISAPSLKKAETLLEKEIAKKRVKSFVADGLNGVPETELVLIAGMGGQEICKILLEAKYKPLKLVLQPMKNADKVRGLLEENGYSIQKDYTFCDGKFYTLIVAELCGKKESLTDDEREFGKTNLKSMPTDFINFIKEEILKIDFYISRTSGNEKEFKKLIKRRERLEGILNGKNSED